MFKVFCIVASALVLLSCTLTEPRPSTPTSSPAGSTLAGQPPAVGQARLPPAGAYRIDSSSSELRLLVYRAGVLANLGHNHVIVGRSVTGSVDVAPTLSASSFSLRAPVAAFIIDDPQARAEEGEDFQTEVSDEARTGTYNNMTGAALLDSMRYPVISVQSTRLEQSQGTLTAIMTVSVAGHESTLSAPFSLSAENYGLAASAVFPLRQSALGLTPFSLMLGALAVRDDILVKLRIAAQLEATR